MSKSYQKLTINIGGKKFRREKLEGRDHLVVPAVILKEAVLNGSEGPIFYPDEENSKDPSVWDAMPIVIDHPEDDDGVPTSARTKEIFDFSKVGVLLNTEYDDEKVRTECWFDEEKLKSVDMRVHNAIIKKKRVEVSTGLGVDLEEKKGTFKGTEYNGIARNYKPDHLAVLPDKVGALSVKDGAGLFANSLAKEPESFQTVAMRTMTEGVKNLGIKITANEVSFNDISRQICDLLMAEYGEPGKYWQGWVVDVFPDYVVYNNDGKLWRQEYSVKDDKVSLTGEATEVRRVVSYTTNSNEGKTMPKATFNKKKFVDQLIANGTAAETDREKLMGTDDSVLAMFETELPPPPKKKVDKEEVDEVDEETVLEDEDPKPTPKKKAKAEPVVNELTEEQALAILPKSIRNRLKRMDEEEDRKKAKLIKIILANKANRFKEEYLKKQDVDFLEGIARLAHVANRKKDDEDDEDGDSILTGGRDRLNYVGNAGGFDDFDDTEDEDDEEIYTPLSAPEFADPRKKK